MNRLIRSARLLALLTFMSVAVSAAEYGEEAASRKEPAPAPGLLETVRRLAQENPAGSFFLALRPRYEYARVDGLDKAHAATLRIAPGFGSRRWHGFSFLIEGEAIIALDGDDYWDATGRPNGESPIADPADVDLNQAYLNWEHADSKSFVRLGRQRLRFDDARFVGNAPWRQNEQTFDAAHVSTAFGGSDFQASYTFIGQVKRVFGDRGPAARRDSLSRSHFLRFGWSPDPRFDLKAYAYSIDLLGLRDASSHTFGGRAAGALPFSERASLEYLVEYAYQVDAADQPVDYATDFVRAQIGVRDERAGRVALAFDRLASDRGRAVFLTPLGSRHGVNGWADVFIDNGGVDGLMDLALSLAPRLPGRFEPLIELHHYWSERASTELGWEIDAQLRYRITPSLSTMGKVAWFSQLSPRAPEDTTRVWFLFEFAI
ncbi:MAG: alginate export family protein [Myxococcota bacterium]